MNKRLEKFSKLIEQRRRAKAVEPAEIQNAPVDVAAGKVAAPVVPDLTAAEEPAPVPEEPVAEEPAPVEESTPVEESPVDSAPVPEEPVAEEPVPVEEPVAEEPVVPETPNRSRKRRGKKSKDAEE